MSDFLTMSELEQQTLKEIYKYARTYKIPYYSQMNKKELSLAIIRAQARQPGLCLWLGYSMFSLTMATVFYGR